MFNSIFAISKDSNISLEYFSSTNSWIDRAQSNNLSCVSTFGITGKFLYVLRDSFNPASLTTVQITDGITWVASSLPNNIVDCICAVRENGQTLSLSYNGINFSLRS
jgi:hypothetical protein